MASTEALPERRLPQRPRAPHAGPIAGRLELLLELVRRDVKSRYRGSVLGVAWTLLNPLIFMIVYALVFGRFLKVHYPGGSATVYILSGLLAWTFFSQALTMATSSIVANAALVRKVAFPWMLLTVSSVIAALVNYAISLLLLIPFMLLSHKGIGPPILAVPVLVAVTFALALGLGLMLAGGNVYMRDLQYLVTLGTLVWFYITPVIYPFTLVETKFSGHGTVGLAAHIVLYANPMTWVVLGFQDVFVFDRWPQHWHGLGYSLVFSLLSIWIGLRVFRRLRRRFADEVLMAEPVIRIDHVSKRFRVYHQRNTTLKQSLIDRRRGRFEEFWAVRDVSVDVPEGQSLGIIGENGSGKSTLLKCVAGIMIQDKGNITVQGRLASLLEVGAGFHPDFTGRENIYLNGAILGLPRRYITSILDTIVGFAGLEQFIDNPVKTYSSGMYTRLGFAIAVNLDPDILVVDEVLAVGDEAFQRRCMERINDLRSEGRTLVFVSHALESVRAVCDRCVWMDRGVARMVGGVDDVLAAYVAEVNRREERELELTLTTEVDTSPGRMGVRIISVDVSGPDGSTAVVNTGDALTVAIGYEAPAPLRGARFSVTFLRADGGSILTVPTDDLETAAAALPRKGVVQLALPGVPFLEGLYRLTVDITEIATGQHYKRLERVRPFRVHSAGHHEVGMALLGHRWELPHVTARVAPH